MFKSLNKSLDQLGRDVSKAADQAGSKFNQAVDSNWKSGLLSGFFGSLERGLSSLVKSTDQAVNYVSNEVDKAFQGSHVDNFRSGNVVQLISRNSGRCLQIVTAPNGQLVVDGVGPEGPQFVNAHWTVLNEGKNVVRLYNQNNYLAIYNGTTCLLQFADPAATSPETRFRLKQINNFVLLESMKEHKHHVGFLKDGALKSALATGTEIDAQFGVRLIYSPYGPPPGAAGGAPAKK